MFELTSSALQKNLRFEQARHPAAYVAASLHEQVLSETLARTSKTESSREPHSEKRVHHLEKVHNRDLLKCYLRRLGLTIDSQLLFDVTADCDFEIWSMGMQFIGCSHGFMRASSYSFQELTETSWSELFTRDPKFQKDVVHAISWLAKDPHNNRYLSRVADWHLVKEVASNRHVVEIRIKSAGVAFAPTGEPKAIVAITQLRPPSGA